MTVAVAVGADVGAGVYDTDTVTSSVWLASSSHLRRASARIERA